MNRIPFIGEPYSGHEKSSTAIDEDLIDGLLPRRGLAIIVGEPGKGKTLMAIHLMKCLATGESIIVAPEFTDEDIINPLLGTPTSKGGSIILAGEGYDTLHLRIETAYASLDEAQRYELQAFKGLPLIHINVKALSSTEHFQCVEQKIAAKVSYLRAMCMAPKIIFIDTLSSALGLNNENDPNEGHSIIDALAELGKQLDCLIVILAHPSKSPFARAGNIRGSGVWESAPDTIWLIRQRSIGGEQIVTLKVTKGKEGYQEGQTYYFKIVPMNRSAYLLPIEKPSHVAEKGTKPLKQTRKEVLLDGIKFLNSSGTPPHKGNIIEFLKTKNFHFKKDGQAMPEVSFNRTLNRELKELRDEKKITAKFENEDWLYIIPSL